MSDEEHFHVSSIPWPVPSPDLKVPVFFLWGCLKECVYRNRLHTAQEQKRAILDEIATINQDMLRQVSWQFCKSFKTMCRKRRRPPSRCYLSKVINNKLLAYYIKLVHFISSLSCCVKYYHVSNSVSRLRATLYIT
jgi:hypothetical protein